MKFLCARAACNLDANYCDTQEKILGTAIMERPHRKYLPTDGVRQYWLKLFLGLRINDIIMLETLRATSERN